MEFRPLDEGDRPAIHRTFREAFADYAVPADFDAATLDRLMRRRGADLSASVGAFAGGDLVAVMVTAVRGFEGIPTAYDVFTGVVPAHRGQRLAGRMFDAARQRLVDRGVRRFLLEVIESNAPAIHAYERTGFVTRRRLACFGIRSSSTELTDPPDGVEVARVDRADWPTWSAWRSWPVSWQNHEDSIEAAVEETVFLRARAGGVDAGYAVVIPRARDLSQLVVRPEFRRRGIGAALLAEARRLVGDGDRLRVINVDSGSAADLGFYTRFGDDSLPAQREMVLEFGD